LGISPTAAVLQWTCDSWHRNDSRLTHSEYTHTHRQRHTHTESHPSHTHFLWRTA